MSLRVLSGVAAAGLVFVAAVVARGGPVTVVHQMNRAFSVSAIEVTRGDVVQFANDDRFDHQIAIDSPSFQFESPGQAPGTVTSVTFSKPGTVDVHCEIHPRMHLAVTVK